MLTICVGMLHCLPEAKFREQTKIHSDTHTEGKIFSHFTRFVMITYTIESAPDSPAACRPRRPRALASRRPPFAENPDKRVISTTLMQ
jgi:hypothetical protein